MVWSSTPAPAIRDVLGKPENLFRCLVGVATLGPLLIELFRRIEMHFVPREVANLLQYSGYRAILTLPASVWWLTTLLSLAIAVGLWHFSAAARMLFTMFSIAFGVLIFFSGICVTSPLVGFLAWLTVMAQGGLLALAYGSSLKDRFS